MNDITIGADVEFFLSHAQRGIVPATSFNCPGSKDEPVSLDSVGTFHRDNISVEIQPLPASTPAEFTVNNLAIWRAIRNRYQGLGLSPYVNPVAQFPRTVLAEIAEANEIGCEPDKCAYTGETAKATSADKLGQYRTASGHIHIGGLEDMDEDQRRQVIQYMDVLEGLTCRSMEDVSTSQGYLRRQWYGQAGRYRIKPYGVEWRTPSNTNWYFWAKKAKNAAELFSSVFVAKTLVESGVTLEAMASPIAIKRLRNAIDNRSYAAPLSRRIGYWQELLSESPECKSVVKKAGKIYGYRPGLYARGRRG